MASSMEYDLCPLSPNEDSYLLQRLAELKCWQKEQEEKLNRQQNVSSNNDDDEDEHENEHSNNEESTINQDLSSLESSFSLESKESFLLHKNDFSEETHLKPSLKTFEELLIEKLGHDDSQQNHNEETPIKNKRPFLRKGSGLIRYGRFPTKIDKKSPRMAPIKSIMKKTSGNIIQDPVELSFLEKLEKVKKSQMKENDELKAFERLEEAACDSSFSSNSSTVRKLIQNISLPSPIYKPCEISQTSTPQKVIGLNESQKSFEEYIEDDDEKEEVEEDTLRNEETNCEKTVRFKELSLCLSPSSISKNSPSSLIGTIFCKERRKIKSKTFLPLSQVPLHFSDKENIIVQETLLETKITELNKEISNFKKENNHLIFLKRKLTEDRKKLGAEIEIFEKAKEIERKRIEEEKRRLKRDTQRLDFKKKGGDSKIVFEQKIESLLENIRELKEENKKKEEKWISSLAKLTEQVKNLEKEKENLQKENHKLKLKGISSKVQTHLCPEREKSPDIEVISYRHKGSVVTNETPQSESVIITPIMSFSPVDSLESDVTLVENSEEPTLTNIVQDSAKSITEKTYSDGSIEIVFGNGNRKEINDKGIKVYYYNGDIKETDVKTGIVKYFYATTQTWHYTHPDNKEIFQFSNGQQEIRYPDGTLEISFPDGSSKKILTDKSEKISFPDGTRVEVSKEGERILFLTNGQREIHTSQYKRREYPDGTVKILYNDGRQETRYASNRIRIKDKNGVLIHDSG